MYVARAGNLQKLSFLTEAWCNISGGKEQDGSLQPITVLRTLRWYDVCQWRCHAFSRLKHPGTFLRCHRIHTCLLSQDEFPLENLLVVQAACSTLPTKVQHAYRWSSCPLISSKNLGPVHSIDRMPCCGTIAGATAYHHKMFGRCSSVTCLVR